MATDQPRFESLDELATATAGALSEAASHVAFEVFSDKEFRRLAKFDGMVQGEQDRIFNELMVAGLVLIRLTLEAPDLRVDPDLKFYVDTRLRFEGANPGPLSRLRVALRRLLRG